MIDLESIFGEPASKRPAAPTPEPASPAGGKTPDEPTPEPAAPPSAPAPESALDDADPPPHMGDQLALRFPSADAGESRDPSPAPADPEPAEPAGDADALELDPAGWPVGSFEPQDCPTCPRLLSWRDAGGRWRCERCDADALARSNRLAAAAARARRRTP